MSNNPAMNYSEKNSNKSHQRDYNAISRENHAKDTPKPVMPVEQEVVPENKVEVKPDTSFSVRVDINYLNIRKGPGMDCEKTGNFTGKGVFTITEVQSGNGSDSGWGRLDSGAGWIALDYTTRV